MRDGPVCKRGEAGEGEGEGFKLASCLGMQGKEEGKEEGGCSCSGSSRGIPVSHTFPLFERKQYLFCKVFRSS